MPESEIRESLAASQSTLRPWPRDPDLLAAMRAQAESDLFWFCQEIRGIPKMDDNHRALCRWLMRHSKTRRRMVLKPRLTFKTSICTIAFTEWRLLRNPNLRFLIDSDLRANAKKMAKVIRLDLEANPRVLQLWGTLKPDVGWSEDEFTILRDVASMEPSVMTAGMDQVVVSQHYPHIIADDLVNHTNVTNREQIAKVIDHIEYLEPLLESPVLNPDADLYLVGNFWDDQDPYRHLLRASGLGDEEIMERLREGECEIGGWEVFYRRAQDDEGRPVYALFTPEFLAEKQRRMEPLKFSAQYLNDPVDVSHAVFRKDDFRYWEAPIPHLARVFMFIDPALSELRSGDYTGILIAGLSPIHQLYLLDGFFGRIQPHELLNKTFLFAEAYQPDIIGIEDIAFQRALKLLLQQEMARRGQWLPMQGYKPGSRETKEERIRAVQPWYMNHAVLHRADDPVMTELEMQLLRFPRRRIRDDLADCLGYIVTQMVPPQVPRRQRREYVPDNLTTGY